MFGGGRFDNDHHYSLYTHLVNNAAVLIVEGDGDGRWITSEVLADGIGVNLMLVGPLAIVVRTVGTIDCEK